MKCSICTSKILRSAVAAGQVEQIIPLGGFKPRKWWRSKCKKRIKADEQLQWHHGNVTTSYGITVPGFAYWDDTLATVVNGLHLSSSRTVPVPSR